MSRCQCQAPGRVQSAHRNQTLDEGAIRVEHVDEPASRTRDVIVLGGILHRIGHEQLATGSLNAKRSEAGGNAGVGEVAGESYLGEGRVKNINGPVVEVS